MSVEWKNLYKKIENSIKKIENFRPEEKEFAKYIDKIKNLLKNFDKCIDEIESDDSRLSGAYKHSNFTIFVSKELCIFNLNLLINEITFTKKHCNSIDINKIYEDFDFKNSIKLLPDREIRNHIMELKNYLDRKKQNFLELTNWDEKFYIEKVEILIKNVSKYEFGKGTAGNKKNKVFSFAEMNTMARQVCDQITYYLSEVVCIVKDGIWEDICTYVKKNMNEKFFSSKQKKYINKIKFFLKEFNEYISKIEKHKATFEVSKTGFFNFIGPTLKIMHTKYLSTTTTEIRDTKKDCDLFVKIYNEFYAHLKFEDFSKLFDNNDETRENIEKLKKYLEEKEPTFVEFSNIDVYPDIKKLEILSKNVKKYYFVEKSDNNAFSLEEVNIVIKQICAQIRNLLRTILDLEPLS
ncbi:MAG: hypothetical protein RsTaC01_0300 [Candidatus Paraimprobicoccus trichonymphae]|uniref:Uncharacterized protein n=1 Tax=Candidatus Paraimprobicoccus trichonymphae TaxID=3033793 RepID=A0AA48I9E8_9FIRM|nr:MAG: hypothetical protein RsTaC01_0300 [Candidatus Paraimprobicoccus trichonymphae]